VSLAPDTYFSERKIVKNEVHLRLAASAVAAVGALTVAGAASAHSHRAHRIERPRAQHRRLVIAGTNENDKIALRLDPSRSHTLDVDAGDDGTTDFKVNLEPIDAITVDGGAGDDVLRIDDSNGAFTDSIPTTIQGGDGNDTLSGGAGNELLLGGAGDDTIDGNGGADVAYLGSGDDSFVWDPGDGSDRIDGQDGNDTMVFNGAAADERVGVSANGDRVTFSRSPGNVTMNTGGVENIDFNGRGGSDSIGVNDLDGTGVSAVNVDLAGTVGRVAVDATNGGDLVTVSGDASGVAVTGQAARVTVLHPQSIDELEVNGLDGNDSIAATGLAASTIGLTLDGGAGNDRIAGGPGVETLLGGDGDDQVDGNGGNDVADLGAGDDTFVWDPGDGSDTIEGGDGNDAMVFNGANGAEQVTVSAKGDHATFFRAQGTITMDTHSVESIDFNALGGADLVTVNDLTGTGVADVQVDLAGTLGGATGDGAADRVVVNGTNGDDNFVVKGGVAVADSATAVDVLHSEAANDRLEIDTLQGTDTVDHGGLTPGVVQLFVNGIAIP
jgi:Ca2+-binding RTX toxin-like protein